MQVRGFSLGSVGVDLEAKAQTVQLEHQAAQYCNLLETLRMLLERGDSPGDIANLLSRHMLPADSVGGEELDGTGVDGRAAVQEMMQVEELGVVDFDSKEDEVPEVAPSDDEKGPLWGGGVGDAGLVAASEDTGGSREQGSPSRRSTLRPQSAASMSSPRKVDSPLRIAFANAQEASALLTRSSLDWEKLEIRPSHSRGNGIFCKEDLSSGVLLGFYAGLGLDNSQIVTLRAHLGLSSASSTQAPGEQSPNQRMLSCNVILLDDDCYIAAHPDDKSAVLLNSPNKGTEVRAITSGPYLLHLSHPSS